MNGDNIVATLEKILDEAIAYTEKAQESPFNKDDPWFEGNLEACKVIRNEIAKMKTMPDPV
jgi:hypothetical protein